MRSMSGARWITFSPRCRPPRRCTTVTRRARRHGRRNVSDWFHVDLSGTAELAQFVPLGRAIKTALFIKNVVSTILSGENPRAKMQRQGQGEVQSWVEQIGELLGRD